MSELIYFKNSKGGVEPQLWHVDDIQNHSLLKTNPRGNLQHPNSLGNNLLKRIELTSEEATLSLDELVKRYPIGK